MRELPSQTQRNKEGSLRGPLQNGKPIDHKAGADGARGKLVTRYLVMLHKAAQA